MLWKFFENITKSPYQKLPVVNEKPVEIEEYNQNQQSFPADLIFEESWKNRHVTCGLRDIQIDSSNIFIFKLDLAENFYLKDANGRVHMHLPPEWVSKSQHVPLPPAALSQSSHKHSVKILQNLRAQQLLRTKLFDIYSQTLGSKWKCIGCIASS